MKIKIKQPTVSNDELRLLCIKNNWFTSGSIRQYEKLFELNSNGATITKLATAIWICSDDSIKYEDVFEELIMLSLENGEIFYENN